MAAVKIPADVHEEMIRHLRSAAPNEGCGLLAAGPDGVVTRVYCLTNIDASPVAYTLDPTEHVRALYDAEGNGWNLVAVFHSHPAGPPIPSSTDVAKALEPDWVYVIVGLIDEDRPAVRGYRIVDGAVDEEPIEVAA